MRTIVKLNPGQEMLEMRRQTVLNLSISNALELTR
jgi:hypothetical protein